MLLETMRHLSEYRIMNMDLAVFIVLLMFYNFIGWFYESTIFSLGEQGKFINKGYFIGPYCPIYGVGFFFNMYMLSDLRSPFKILVISMATCTVIEYVTSYVLEKLFDARYWDYSYYPLNINGRVSLPSSFFFGFTIMFMMKVVHPLLAASFGIVPKRLMNILAAALTVLFIADAIITFVCMENLNRKCRELYDAWDNYVDGKLEVLNEKKEGWDRFRIVRNGKKIMVKAKNVNRMFVELETRYLRNSGFHSTKYGELVEAMKARFRTDEAEKAESGDDRIDQSEFCKGRNDQSEFCKGRIDQAEVSRGRFEEEESYDA